MLLIGVAGTELTAQERDWLQHDAVAGVVLFKRNFASRGQVVELTSAIRAATARPLLLAVDQEGGRVQRFREGYADLPPLDGIGRLYAQDRDAALALAEQHAWLMASEIRASGLDLSFAPVVDVGHGNLAIGNRAFSEDPQAVAALTAAYVRGMHSVGMAATLKHFPGHGTVREDTHVDTAVDPRTLQEIESHDLLPFRAGIAAARGRCGDDGPRHLPAGGTGTGGLFAALDQPDPAPGHGFPWGGVLRRHRHGGLVRSRWGQGARGCPPGCRLRRGAGLPPRAGRRIAAGRGRPQPQHCRRAGPDQPRRDGLGRPAGRHPPWRHSKPFA